MPTVLQFRRGTTAQNDSFTGAAGELSIDTQTDNLRLHDGTTAGGFEITRNTATQTLTNKTIDSASNTLTLDLSEGTLTGTTAEFNTALSDGSFATLAGTEALTNKTISGSSNTLSNIGNSSLTNSTITVAGDSGSNAVDLGDTLTVSGTSNEIETSVSGDTITIGLPNDVVVGNDLTVTGNLTVSGTTTTVDTTNTVVSDTLLELGNGTTGTPSNDAGIVIERGDSNNAFMGFDESADKFIVGTGTFTGASTGNLTISTGTMVANVEGNLTGDVTGNADTATILETARTIGGVSFNGSANINLPGVNTTGNQDTSGNAATATALETGRTIGLSGDVTATGVSFDGTGNITLSTTIAANSVALGTDTTGNYVATISAGTGISGSSSTEGGTPTIALSHLGLESLTDPDADRIFFWDDSAGSSAFLTVGTNLTLSGTTLSADTQSPTAGTAIDVSGTTVNLDLSELSTSTTDGDGDFFVVVDSVNAQRKLTKGNINISGFNNDAGYSTTTGTVTSVTGGNGLTGSVTTSGSLAVGAGTGIDVGADSISVDVSDFMTNGSDNRVVTATGTDAMNAEANMTFDGSTLDVTGAIRATGDITAFYTSDESLKTNIETIENPMDKVKEIKGISYNWTPEALEKYSHLTDNKEVGVIAQDVEKVLPEIVATRTDGTKAVRYERMCALLIECVKDLQNQIDELKK